ncbi:MAG TPA: TIGR02281 family clan AA aspartic protease [Phenylobacterium sp.]|nr:TIGR02281 family clan AA aspartic protease [Phenylobacterium sp.]
MSHDSGPWRPGPPEPPPRPPRRRLAILLAVAVAVGLLIWVLARAFPENLRTGEDWAWVAQASLVVLIVGAGVFRLSRGRWVEHLRHAAVWLAIIAVLVLGYAYRTELHGVIQRVQGAFGPGVPIATATHELVVNQDDEGGFIVLGEVNGQRVRFLVDTGSSDTVLAPADAARLGMDVKAMTFNRTAETANGLGYGAPFTADSLQIGPIRLMNVPMVINQAPMSASLLGMTFLSRLASFEIRDRKLYLKWSDAKTPAP